MRENAGYPATELNESLGRRALVLAVRFRDAETESEEVAAKAALLALADEAQR
jgi:hypothetical protein